ncbi:hypothetical protein [Nocardiopsis synnemataformans]|uniref:hypothetical protein n=1 Tax=Nocardiopsis synnemataformans TaxID=61305 RepID=UPI003EBD720B
MAAPRKTPTTKAAPKKKAPAKPPQTPDEAQPHAVVAARAEAMSGDVAVAKVITWRGQTYSVPPSAEEWSIEVAEAFEDGRVIQAVRGILGPDQWASMKAKLKPKVKDLNELAELIGQTYGFESPGE